MSAGAQQWELFGFDVRRVGRHWRSAWRDFLFGSDSPLEAMLDETVCVHDEQGLSYYQAGRAVTRTDAACEAVLLPDELVLARELQMPASAEADLESVMAFEVSANSPFPAADTASGWRIVARDASQLRVCLALVSRSATMTYLGSQYDCHDAQAREVWARHGDHLIVLRGFGEGQRLRRYQSRLLRVGAWLLGALAALVLVAACVAGIKYFELRQYQDMAGRIQSVAQRPSELRGRLVTASDTITAVGAFVQRHPNPHRELTRLTSLLGDEAFLMHFVMSGNEIRVRGRARGAAAVIESLTEVEAYASVVTNGNISALGNTGYEQFAVIIQLQPADAS